jgi:hypothetical protein
MNENMKQCLLRCVPTERAIDQVVLSSLLQVSEGGQHIDAGIQIKHQDTMSVWLEPAMLNPFYALRAGHP